jgi:hypothetical protein
MKPTGDMTNIAPDTGGHERDPQTLGNHRFVDHSLDDMLRKCVRVTSELGRDEGGLHVTIGVAAQNVGHRVPTGFIDRHLVLIVEGLTATGEARPPLHGPQLPEAAGDGFSGKGGKLYAKLLHDEKGHSPVPFWRSDPTPRDNRLMPGERDDSTFVFAGNVVRVKVRLIYRRFWPETSRIKKWPAAEIVLFEEICEK